jgi:uncharacterized protein YndB with AHSA1/START domain
MRVELQAEVPGRRADLFALVATPEGLSRWLDEAEMAPLVGAAVRLRLRDATAVGKVVALSPPQHLSLSWEWLGARSGAGVVAFDLIDHGTRTHLTLRHVGLRTAAEAELHAEVWRHWFARLVAAATELGQGRPEGQPA